MNYVEDIIEELHKELPTLLRSLLEMYALLVLTTGVNTTLENVHDAWALNKTGVFPEHRSIIPFVELSPEVQELDRKYKDAIVKVAERRLP